MMSRTGHGRLKTMLEFASDRPILSKSPIAYVVMLHSLKHQMRGFTGSYPKENLTEDFDTNDLFFYFYD